MTHKHAALRIAGFALVLRLALTLSSPVELLGDEAHYWEWSRHPSLSYYTKGPGVAWVMKAATTVLGDSEWCLRFPAAILGFITTLAIASLARRTHGGCRATGAYAALFVSLYPPFMMMAFVMTIDAPFLGAWAVSMLLAWKLFGPDPCRKPLLHAGALGLVLGLGFLAKYTILLLAPGLLIYALTTWRLRSERRNPWVFPVAAIAFLVTVSPVIIWNQIHHWPTFTHLLGHLHVEGGDKPARPWKPWATVPEFLGIQLLLLGPFALLLWWTFRRRGPMPEPHALGKRFLLMASLPNLAFYAAVSVKAKVQANWPIPSFLGLLVLAAAFVASVQKGVHLYPPSRRALKTTLGVALACGLVIPLAFLISPVLVNQPEIAKRAPFRRVTAGRRHAERYQRALEQVREETGEEPLLITHRYDTTSLMAYYLQGKPRVFSATSHLGGRKSAYDFFAETNLKDPALIGRPALLFRGKPEKWHKAFILEGFRPLDKKGEIIFVARYGGPRK